MNFAWKRNYWSLYKEDMKTVRVVAAVICSEDKIFATARGYGEFKGQWEFPGGKIEPGGNTTRSPSKGNSRGA